MLACDDEHFGQSCNETCGKCFGADACYKDNGTCPGGCEAGYEGNTCKDGTKWHYISKTNGMQYICNDDLNNNITLWYNESNNNVTHN